MRFKLKDEKLRKLLALIAFFGMSREERGIEEWNPLWA